MTDPLFLSAAATDALPGSTLTIDGDEGRHAAAVKRMRVGESVLVADGVGRAIRGEVASVAKASIDVAVAEVLHAPVDPHRWVCVQALAKGDRAGLAVELLTEVGADEILAWQASRSVSRWDQGKADKPARSVDKWRATAREATKQSRRFRVPAVELTTTDQVCERMADGCWLVLHEDADADIADVSLPISRSVGVVVGPEGGISPDELRVFVAAGARPVRMSDAVLRTSTAGGVAIAQLRLLARLRGGAR